MGAKRATGSAAATFWAGRRGDPTSATVTVPLPKDRVLAPTLAAHDAVALTSRAGFPPPPPGNRSEVVAGLCQPLRRLAALAAAFLAFDHALAATFSARGSTWIGRSHCPASSPRVQSRLSPFSFNRTACTRGARVHKAGNRGRSLRRRAGAASGLSPDGDLTFRRRGCFHRRWRVPLRPLSARTAAPPTGAGRASATPAASGTPSRRKMPPPPPPGPAGRLARGACSPWRRSPARRTRRRASPPACPSSTGSPAAALYAAPCFYSAAIPASASRRF